MMSYLGRKLEFNHQHHQHLWYILF